jgi:hypothetical protein
MIIFTSPETNRLKELGKNMSSARYYMDTWTLEELQNCAHSCHPDLVQGRDMDLSKYIAELYSKFGGIIRYFMRTPSKHKPFGMWLNQYVNSEIRGRVDDLTSYKDVIKALNVAEDKSTPKSYVLAHIRTLTEERIGDYDEIEAVCGSNYVRDLLVKKIEEELNEESIKAFFTLSGAGSKATAIKGQLFQPIVQRALGETWDGYVEQNAIRYLGDDEQAPIKTLKVQMEAMTVHECRSTLEVQEKLKSSKNLVVSLNESFPIGDSVRRSPPRTGADYDIFQSTVSNEHPLTQNGLNQLKRILPKRHDRGNPEVTILRIFFCVPPHRFRRPRSTLPENPLHIKKQPIHVSKENKERAACPQGLQIHQFALEVNPSLIKGHTTEHAWTANPRVLKRRYSV